MAMRQHLGQMTITAGATKNNLTTAVPFALPCGLDSILVLASGADCYANCVKDVGTLVATTANESIGTAQYQIPCIPMAPSGPNDYSNVLAIFNNNVASRTVDVWAVYA